MALLDSIAAVERPGTVRYIIGLFQNPKFSLLIVTVVIFILVLLFILNIIPWGTGRGCWAQC